MQVFVLLTKWLTFNFYKIKFKSQPFSRESIIPAAVVATMLTPLEDYLAFDDVNVSEACARRDMQQSKLMFAEKWSELCNISKDHAFEIMNCSCNYVNAQKFMTLWKHAAKGAAPVTAVAFVFRNQI